MNFIDTLIEAVSKRDLGKIANHPDDVAAISDLRGRDALLAILDEGWSSMSWWDLSKKRAFVGAVMEALANIGDPVSVKPILEFLRKTCCECATGALDALKRLGANPSDFFIDFLQQIPIGQIHPVLVEIQKLQDSRAFEYVIKRAVEFSKINSKLGFSADAFEKTLTSCLDSSTHERSAELLGKVLVSEDQDLQRIVINVLVKMSSPSSLPPLIETILSSTDRWLVVSAMKAIGELSFAVDALPALRSVYLKNAPMHGQVSVLSSAQASKSIANILQRSGQFVSDAELRELVAIPGCVDTFGDGPDNFYAWPQDREVRRLSQEELSKRNLRT